MSPVRCEQKLIDLCCFWRCSPVRATQRHRATSAACASASAAADCSDARRGTLTQCGSAERNAARQKETTEKVPSCAPRALNLLEVGGSRYSKLFSLQRQTCAASTRAQPDSTHASRTSVGTHTVDRYRVHTQCSYDATYSSGAGTRGVGLKKTN